MPTGTRSSISPNSATKPRIATASVLNCASLGYASFDRLYLVLAAKLFGMENQPIGAHRDQEHGRRVADPGDEEKRPHRQPQIVGQHMVGARTYDLTEQSVSLHRHDEQQHQSGENIDSALPPG